MSSGFLLLHLFLWSFSTSISNGPTDLTSAARVEPSASHDARDGSFDTRSQLPLDFPTNIVVQQELREAVSRLWAGSATFRAQCLKIGERRLYRVAVMLDPVLSLNGALPRAMRAARLLVGLRDGAHHGAPPGRLLDELIPHELEHVARAHRGHRRNPQRGQVRHRRLRRRPRPHRDRPRHAGGPSGQGRALRRRARGGGPDAAVNSGKGGNTRPIGGVAAV